MEEDDERHLPPMLHRRSNSVPAMSCGVGLTDTEFHQGQLDRSRSNTDTGQTLASSKRQSKTRKLSSGGLLRSQSKKRRAKNGIEKNRSVDSIESNNSSRKSSTASNHSGDENIKENLMERRGELDSFVLDNLDEIHGKNMDSTEDFHNNQEKEQTIPRAVVFTTEESTNAEPLESTSLNTQEKEQSNIGDFDTDNSIQHSNNILESQSEDILYKCTNEGESKSFLRRRSLPVDTTKYHIDLNKDYDRCHERRNSEQFVSKYTETSQVYQDNSLENFRRSSLPISFNQTNSDYGSQNNEYCSMVESSEGVSVDVDEGTDQSIMAKVGPSLEDSTDNTKTDRSHAKEEHFTREQLPKQLLENKGNVDEGNMDSELRRSQSEPTMTTERKEGLESIENRSRSMPRNFQYRGEHVETVAVQSQPMWSTKDSKMTEEKWDKQLVPDLSKYKREQSKRQRRTKSLPALLVLDEIPEEREEEQKAAADESLGNITRLPVTKAFYELLRKISKDQVKARRKQVRRTHSLSTIPEKRYEENDQQVRIDNTKEQQEECEDHEIINEMKHEEHEYGTHGLHEYEKKAADGFNEHELTYEREDESTHERHEHEVHEHVKETTHEVREHEEIRQNETTLEIHKDEEIHEQNEDQSTHERYEHEEMQDKDEETHEIHDHEIQHGNEPTYELHDHEEIHEQYENETTHERYEHEEIQKLDEDEVAHEKHEGEEIQRQDENEPTHETPKDEGIHEQHEEELTHERYEHEEMQEQDEDEATHGIREQELQQHENEPTHEIHKDEEIHEQNENETTHKRYEQEHELHEHEEIHEHEKETTHEIHVDEVIQEQHEDETTHGLNEHEVTQEHHEDESTHAATNGKQDEVRCKDRKHRETHEYEVTHEQNGEETNSKDEEQYKHELTHELKTMHEQCSDKQHEHEEMPHQNERTEHEHEEKPQDTIHEQQELEEPAKETIHEHHGSESEQEVQFKCDDKQESELEKQENGPNSEMFEEKLPDEVQHEPVPENNREIDEQKLTYSEDNQILENNAEVFEAQERIHSAKEETNEDIPQIILTQAATEECESVQEDRNTTQTSPDEELQYLTDPTDLQTEILEHVQSIDYTALPDARKPQRPKMNIVKLMDRIPEEVADIEDGENYQFKREGSLRKGISRSRNGAVGNKSWPSDNKTKRVTWSDTNDVIEDNYPDEVDAYPDVPTSQEFSEHAQNVEKETENQDEMESKFDGLLRSAINSYLEPDYCKSTSPIHRAVAMGSVDTLVALINEGKDVNAHDEHGRPPLHVAMLTNNVDCAAILLEAGADLEQYTNTLVKEYYTLQHRTQMECLI